MDDRPVFLRFVAASSADLRFGAGFFADGAFVAADRIDLVERAHTGADGNRRGTFVGETESGEARLRTFDGGVDGSLRVAGVGVVHRRGSGDQ